MIFRKKSLLTRVIQSVSATGVQIGSAVVLEKVDTYSFGEIVDVFIVREMPFLFVNKLQYCICKMLISMHILLQDLWIML